MTDNNRFCDSLKSNIDKKQDAKKWSKEIIKSNNHMYKENGFDSTKNDGAMTCIMDEGVLQGTLQGALEINLLGNSVHVYDKQLKLGP